MIGEDGRTDALGLEHGLDGAVTTTALHYLQAPAPLKAYQSIAALLRPGRALINGGHFPPDGPSYSDLTAHVGGRRAERAGGESHEDWESWWSAAAAHPELENLFEQRERSRPSSGGGGENWHLPVSRHAELLWEAGFSRVTPVWQVGDSCVLVALKD